MANRNQPLTDDQIQQVAKKKRTRPDRSEAMSVHTEPGENTKYLNHSLHMWDWQKVDFQDNNAVMERTRQYFQLCADDDMKPSVEGLALAYGINRRTLWRYANGVDCGHIPDLCKDTIKKAYVVLNAQMADYMQNGKINPVTGIFLMKNNMGYEDKTEMVVTPNQPLGDQKQPEQLEEYLNTIDSE